MLGGELKNDLEKLQKKRKKASNTENSGARAVFGKGGQGYWVFWRWFNSCYGFHNPSLLVSKLSLVSRLLKVLNFYPLVRSVGFAGLKGFSYTALF